MSAANRGEAMLYEHYRVVTDVSGKPVKLGEGAMGVTYLAEDTKLRVKVALKVIRTALLGDSDTAQRFQGEARSAARLKHPNVATVYHLGETGDSFFYAMEFVEGESLHEYVKKKGTMPVKLALQVCLQLCDALGAAERMRMVHRDIKPANIMLETVDEEELRAKLIDFGLAKALHPESDGGLGLQTQVGVFLGTPGFASPEQAQDAPLDTRSDFYAIGLTLWFMLEGRPPFEGSIHKVLVDQAHAPPPIARLAWVPAEVRNLILKLLEKDPGRRPQTAREFRHLLNDCLRAVSSDSGDLEWRRRFQIVAKPRTQPWGATYDGQDTLSGAVWLHHLRTTHFEGTDTLQRVIAEARRAIEIQHPNVLRHFTVFPSGDEGDGGGWVIVTEHPGKQSLLNVLRQVGHLPSAEAYSLIECLAAAVDNCLRHQFLAVDLDPARIYIKGVPDPSGGLDPSLVTPKLCPINYTALAAAFEQGDADAAMTQVFVRHQPKSPHETVQRFALLAYECLGGPAGSHSGRLSRYVPLPLGSRVNAVLRDALMQQTFATAGSFVEALLQIKKDTKPTPTAPDSPKKDESMLTMSGWSQLIKLASDDSFDSEADTILQPPRQSAAPPPVVRSESPSYVPPPPLQWSDEDEIEAPEAPPDMPPQRAMPPTITSLPSPPVAPPRIYVAEKVAELPPALQEESPPESAVESLEPAAKASTPPPLSEKRADEEEIEIPPAPPEAPPERAVPPTLTSFPFPPSAQPRIYVAERISEPPPPLEVEPPAEPAAESLEGFVETSTAPPVSEIAPLEEPSVSTAFEFPPAPPTLPPPVHEPTVTIALPENDSEPAPTPGTAPHLVVPAVPTTAAAGLPALPISVAPPPMDSDVAEPPTIWGELLRPDQPTADEPKPRQLPKRGAWPAWAVPTGIAATLLLTWWAWGQLGHAPSPQISPKSVPQLSPVTPKEEVVIKTPPPHVEEPVVPVAPSLPPPQPPPPPPSTLAELLQTGAAAAAKTDPAKLAQIWDELQFRFPDIKSWESTEKAPAFQRSVVRAYREGKLGESSQAARRYLPVLFSDTDGDRLEILTKLSRDLEGDPQKSPEIELALLEALSLSGNNKDYLDRALRFLQRWPGAPQATKVRTLTEQQLAPLLLRCTRNPRQRDEEEVLLSDLEALAPELDDLVRSDIPSARYLQAYRQMKQNHEANAIALLGPAAKAGHIQSMTLLGFLLSHSNIPGRPPDNKASAEWFKRATDLKDPKARCLLGECYLYNDRGVEQNTVLGFQLLDASAKEDNLPEAHYIIGDTYLKSFLKVRSAMDMKFSPELTGDKRLIEARKHLEAAQTLPRALVPLAYMYLWGQGGAKDVRGALSLLKKGVYSLSTPEPDCQFFYAFILDGNPLPAPDGKTVAVSAEEFKENGVKKDVQECAKLMRSAAATGFLPAQDWCQNNGISYK